MLRLIFPAAILVLLFATMMRYPASARAERFEDAHTLPIKTSDGNKLHEPVHAAFADLNGDALADLVVANGRDVSENGLILEPLIVYFNQGDAATADYAPFANPPASSDPNTYVWRSNTKRQYTHVCPVDIDGDGCMDVAATFIETNGKTLDIYRNEKQGGACKGLKDPPLSLPHRYPGDPFAGAAWGCAAGDVDADGDGDLGIAEAYATVPSNLFGSAKGLVYLLVNDDGTYSHSWQNAESDIRHAFDLSFADVDTDGVPDLVAAMAGLRVYAGNGTLFETTASRTWNMGSAGFTADVDTSWVEDDGHAERGIVVAGNNRFGTAATYGFYRLFKTCIEPGGLCETWLSPDTGKGDAVALLDLDDNNHVDTASVRWSAKECDEPYDPTQDSTIVYWDLFQGNSVAMLNGVVERNILGQGLIPWEFAPDEIITRSFGTDLPAGASFLSFDGPDAPTFVMNVNSVVDQEGDEINYHFTPGNDWLSLQPPIADSGTMTVTYQTSNSPDLVIVDGCGFIHFFKN